MLKTAQESLFLAEVSASDRYWDNLKRFNYQIQLLYQGTDYSCYAVRMHQCSGSLVFRIAHLDSGLCKLTLHAARFCRILTCPICQKRRAMKWQAKTFSILPLLFQEYPCSRFFLLTLTIRNPHVGSLRDALEQMHRAWTKLVKRKEWALVQGWVRSIEVTRSAHRDQHGRILRHTNDAHPHYHVFVMVKSSYFGGNYYVTQDRWVEVWRSCLDVDYSPIVDIRAIKQPKNRSREAVEKAVMESFVEVVKYLVKPSDLAEDVVGEGLMSKSEWLVELTNQMFNIKKITTGGVLKQYYKLLESQQDDDLININDDDQSESNSDDIKLTFTYDEFVKRYKL